MRPALLSALIALLPLPALSGVAEAVDQHILPATAAFSQAAQALQDTAASDCRATTLRPVWQETFDGWMGLSHLGFGPLEQDGRGLIIEFWPDPRGLVTRSVARLIRDTDPIVDDPARFPDLSIASRGLMAMELLLFDPDLSTYAADDYACRYARAIAGDLADIAQAVDQDWQDHAQLMLTAGAGNPRYLSEREATQALYTALLGGLEFDADQRLGRPLGTDHRPRPALAEARRAGRSLRNIQLSLTALHDLARHLAAGPIPLTDAAFGQAVIAAQAVADPALAGVDDPEIRPRILHLQQQIRALRNTIRDEIGSQLGLSAGFNALDGD